MTDCVLSCQDTHQTIQRLNPFTEKVFIDKLPQKNRPSLVTDSTNSGRKTNISRKANIGRKANINQKVRSVDSHYRKNILFIQPIKISDAVGEYNSMYEDDTYRASEKLSDEWIRYLAVADLFERLYLRYETTVVANSLPPDWIAPIGSTWDQEPLSEPEPTNMIIHDTSLNENTLETDEPESEPLS